MLPFRCKAFLPSSRYVHHSVSRGHLCRATRVLYEWLLLQLHAIMSNRMPFLHPPPSTARILGLSTTIAVSLVLVNMARSLSTSPNYDNGSTVTIGLGFAYDTPDLARHGPQSPIIPATCTGLQLTLQGRNLHPILASTVTHDSLHISTTTLLLR
jgi:hypothetical protein